MGRKPKARESLEALLQSTSLALLAARARSDLPCEFGETARAMAERNGPALARALKRPSVQRSG